MRHLAHTGSYTSVADDISLYEETLRVAVDLQDLTVPEASLILPFLDHSDDIRRAKEQFGNIRHLFVVGIGGSSLGIEAVASAFPYSATAVLTVFDTLSVARIEHTLSDIASHNISKDDIAICIISKSGSTTETITNAALLLSKLEAHFGESIASRVAVITDKDSALDACAATNGYTRFYIPHAVGGRYSVFSAVGVIPLALLGIDVIMLLSGAKETISQILDESDEGSEVVLKARAIAFFHEHGITTLDTFVFDSRLYAYALWRRQLLAESLGKSEDMVGTKGIYGPLPTASHVGDLHSVVQLYLSGARGIHTDFVTFETYDDAALPEHPLLAIIPALNGRHTLDISRALQNGVLDTYQEQKLSYSEYQLTKLSEYELGALMATNMLETMYVAKLLHLNAFDQPNVELYKKNMREHLAQSGG